MAGKPDPQGVCAYLVVQAPRRGTHTRGCVIELAGTRFRKVNELRDRRRRKRGMNGENIGVTGDQADRREIALGIIAELAVQRGA